MTEAGSVPREESFSVSKNAESSRGVYPMLVVGGAETTLQHVEQRFTVKSMLFCTTTALITLFVCGLLNGGALERAFWGSLDEKSRSLRAANGSYLRGSL